MKLHLICSKDELRPMLNYVRVLDNQAVATDGHVLGCLSSLPFELPDGFLHREDWRILSRFKYGRDYIDIQGDFIVVVTPGQTRYLKHVPFAEWEDKFPAWENLIPKAPFKPVPEIGVSSKLITHLTSSLGFERIRMSFSGGNKPILVESLDADNRGFGVIMPVTLPKD